MTQEEKARAYDEALERAKFYYGNCPSEPEKKKLEEMFPKLRKSEDERMYETIYSIISEHYDRLMSYQVCSERKAEFVQERDKILIYLEKQKEQKSISQEDFDTAKHEVLWGKREHTEWGEEDETKLRDVVRLIEDSGHVESIREHYKKFLTSLPERFNLRSSWKPSEEQMAGLLVAIGDEKERGSDVAKTLRSLYEQLKKL